MQLALCGGDGNERKRKLETIGITRVPYSYLNHVTEKKAPIKRAIAASKKSEPKVSTIDTITLDSDEETVKNHEQENTSEVISLTQSDSLVKDTNESEKSLDRPTTRSMTKPTR